MLSGPSCCQTLPFSPLREYCGLAPKLPSFTQPRRSSTPGHHCSIPPPQACTNLDHSSHMRGHAPVQLLPIGASHPTLPLRMPSARCAPPSSLVSCCGLDIELRLLNEWPAPRPPRCPPKSSMGASRPRHQIDALAASMSAQSGRHAKSAVDRSQADAPRTPLAGFSSPPLSGFALGPSVPGHQITRPGNHWGKAAPSR